MSMDALKVADEKETKRLLEKFGLTEEWIEQSAAQYERGDYPSGGGPVHYGSHLDAVGKKRVTVVYDASATQRVAHIARERGVRPSTVYRDALDYYLSAQERQEEPAIA